LKTSEKNTNRSKEIGAIPVPIAIIVGLILASPLFFWFGHFWSLKVSPSPEDWSFFATYITGTIGTLITFFGFIYIFLTYRSQIRNNYTTGFENTFFKMIEFHFKIIEGISSSDGSSGKKALVIFAATIGNHYTKLFGEHEYNEVYFSTIRAKIVQTYADIYGSYFYRIGHYFRHLYHIFKYIADSNLSQEQKIQYARILRSQLSTEEIILIGINGLTVYGEKFKPLIEEYAVLHRLLNFDYYRALFISSYDPSAFGDEDIHNSLPENSDKKFLYEKTGK